MYTSCFEELYNQYFLPSIKDDFELVVQEYPQYSTSGTFRSEGWEKTMLCKLELLQRAILENWNDKVFFYSDIDIIFFKPILEICLECLGENDFVVQQGWPRNRLCAGFFVMKGNEKNLKLVTDAHGLLERKVFPDDQKAIQAILDGLKPGELTWKFLPAEQFPNGRRVLKHVSGYFTKDSEIEVESSVVMFHANCCIGLENKYLFLKKVQEQYLMFNP